MGWSNEQSSVSLPCSSCLNLATIQMCISNVPRQGCTGELLRKNLITRIPRFCCTKFKNRFLRHLFIWLNRFKFLTTSRNKQGQILSRYFSLSAIRPKSTSYLEKSKWQSFDISLQVPKVPILWAMFNSSRQLIIFNLRLSNSLLDIIQ